MKKGTLRAPARVLKGPHITDGWQESVRCLLLVFSAVVRWPVGIFPPLPISRRHSLISFRPPSSLRCPPCTVTPGHLLLATLLYWNVIPPHIDYPCWKHPSKIPKALDDSLVPSISRLPIGVNGLVIGQILLPLALNFTIITSCTYYLRYQLIYTLPFYASSLLYAFPNHDRLFFSSSLLPSIIASAIEVPTLTTHLAISITTEVKVLTRGGTQEGVW